MNRGRISRLDPTRAEAMPGVLTVLTPANAPRLRGRAASDLPVLQSLDVHYQGQVVAAVVAETSEIAKAAVGAVVVEYAAEPPDVVLHRRPGRPLRAREADGRLRHRLGDRRRRRRAGGAPVSVDATYETPTQHNNPIEMHTTRWPAGTATR